MAVAKKLIEQGKIKKDQSVVIAITGNGLKTQEAIQSSLTGALEIEPHLKSFEEKILNSCKL